MSKKIKILIYSLVLLLSPFYVTAETLAKEEILKKLLRIENKTGTKTVICSYLNQTQDDDDLNSGKERLLLGVFNEDNKLIDSFFEKTFYPEEGNALKLESVTTKNLNNDEYPDLIVGISELGSNNKNIETSIFFIHNGKSFVQISNEFTKGTYLFLNNHHIQVKKPINLYGNPYDQDQENNNDLEWANHYAFKGTRLIKVNQLYRSFYEKELETAKINLDNTLKKVKNYRMKDRKETINQLQLNQYYTEISSLKVFIAKCNKILNR